MNASKNKGSIPDVLTARFDVYASSGKGRARTSYLSDVQSDVVDGLTTRVVVAPIEAASFPPVKLPADSRRRSISVEFGGCMRRAVDPGRCEGGFACGTQ
ncbi:CcdB family protein [Caballeronia grimmiae]|uniref:CcdB family protein n=1 Tax=Caballeronia grimmiae TaxID=1071679 RepID=UPI0038B84BA9